MDKDSFEQEVEDAVRSNNLLPETARSIIKARRSLRTDKLLNYEEVEDAR